MTERQQQETNEDVLSRTEKEEKLQQLRKAIEKTGDRLGHGVDNGIKETVAACAVTGLPTSASCEGHIGWGYSVPWVEVKAPGQPKWRFKDEEEIYEQVAKKYGITIKEVRRADNEDAWVEAHNLSIERGETAEYKAWEEENKKLLVKAEALLQEFYKEREVEKEIRIIAARGVGRIRLHGGGKFYIPSNNKDRLQKELTEEERLRIPEILKLSQQEMAAFTDFLEKKYLEEI